MKLLLIIFIGLCVIFFIGGYFLVRLAFLSEDAYIAIASISGALASVVGLLSLVRPSIAKSDIDALEVDALRKVSELSHTIEQAKERQSETEEEIARLAARKEEMELLVKKASLSLFLHDQVAKKAESTNEIIAGDKELTSLIQEYSQSFEKLKALDEEIETDPNVELLKEIIEEAESRREREDEDPVILLVRSISRVAELFLGRVIR